MPRHRPSVTVAILLLAANAASVACNALLGDIHDRSDAGDARSPREVSVDAGAHKDGHTGHAPDSGHPVDAGSDVGRRDVVATDHSSPMNDGGAPSEGGRVDGSKDAREASRFDPGAGDRGDACAPPAGGFACTPGVVVCESPGNLGGTCDLSSQICCEVPDGNASCVSADGGCTSGAIHCDEAADCAEGLACCFGVPPDSGVGTATCQALSDGGECPRGDIVQLCRSSAECPSGHCNRWKCQGVVLEACANPLGACEPAGLDAGDVAPDATGD